jgi:uncharacterized delta-60 repeat protein
MKRYTFLFYLLLPCFLTAQNPGSLDVSFGNAGTVLTNIPAGFQNAAGLTIQPDGKIIALGSYISILPLTCARYLSNGTLDPNFATNGIYNLSSFGVSGVEFSELWSVSLQTDGKILLSGMIKTSSGSQMYVRRLNANGTPDSSFGTGGFFRSDIINNANPYRSAVYICTLPDNKIMVFTAVKNLNKFTLLRLNANGTLDTSFGTSGILDLNSSTAMISLRASSIYSLPGEKLLVYGHSQSKVHIFRLLADGTPDATFATNGEYVADDGVFDTDRVGLTPMPDGRIVGLRKSGGNRVFRLKADGTPDNTFGSNGSMTLATSISNVYCQADGKIIALGTFNGLGIVARVNANGTLDNTFGSSGFYYGPTAKTYKFAAQQADGKIIAFGTNAGDFVLTRHYSQVIISSTENPELFQTVEVAPNPVADWSNLTFELPEPATVSVTLYQINGQVVSTLQAPSRLPAGRQSFQFDLSTLPAGNYCLQLKSNNETVSRIIQKQ